MTAYTGKLAKIRIKMIVRIAMLFSLSNPPISFYLLRLTEKKIESVLFIKKVKKNKSRPDKNPEISNIFLTYFLRLIHSNLHLIHVLSQNCSTV